MVVGQGGAGKTATVRALTNKRFDEEWKSTIGISMEECKTTTKGSWADANRAGFAMDIANRLLIQEMDKPSFLRKKSVKQRKSLQKNGRNTHQDSSTNETEEGAEEGRKTLNTSSITSVNNEAIQLSNVPSQQKDTEASKEERPIHRASLKLDDSLYAETRNNKDSVRLTVFRHGWAACLLHSSSLIPHFPTPSTWSFSAWLSCRKMQKLH